jgi:hypothetical protein
MKNIQTYKLFENSINQIILDFRTEYPDGVNFVSGEYGVDIEACLDIIKQSTKMDKVSLKNGIYNYVLALKITDFNNKYTVSSISNPNAYVFNIYTIITIDEFIKTKSLDKLFNKINKINKFNL